MPAESVTITLPLPPKELSPNHTVGSRGGRLGKATKIKKYRGGSHAAAWFAFQATGQRCSPNGPQWPAATVECRFYFSRRGRRDCDNLLASMKSAFDGLTDAGLIADDAGLTHLPVVIDYDKANPRVELVVTKVAGGGGAA